MVLELKEKRSNGLLIGIRDETRFSSERQIYESKRIFRKFHRR